MCVPVGDVRVGRGAGVPCRSMSSPSNPKIAVFQTRLIPNLVSEGAPHGVTLVGLVLVLVHCLFSLAWLASYAACLV